MDREEAFEALLELHGEVDREAARLTTRHAERLECRRGCSACCIDELTVFEVEAERIRRHAAAILDAPPGPAGGCAFLDAGGACRVYADRPYVCRTQGLPLAWFEEGPDDDIVQRRTICELNDEGEPLESLDKDEVWLLGPNELGLQRLQQAFGGDQARVALRDLFSTQNAPPPAGDGA
ncbi:MAG: YkgJ family cysteine cluster protein [Planctomycetota bacterium]|nr:YkgJ family cysteine cluster protein [Planctomycetota bacterium]